MSRPIKLLLVEDSSDDALLLLHELQRGGYEPQYERVMSAEEMQAALNKQWDLIISDYVIPGFGGLEALALYRKSGLDIPFLITSGHIGEETAVAAIKAGAHDYIMKDRLARLVPAIERCLEEAAIRRAHGAVQRELAVKARELEVAVDELRLTEAQLRQTNRELTEAREKLEVRVQERTADLSRANAELGRQITQRKRLENELLETVEDERRTIGFDLHDDIGQRLMGLSMLLKGIETRLAHKQSQEVQDAREANQLLGQIIQYTRDLPLCFSPAAAEKGESLPCLIRTLAQNVRRTFQIKCALHLGPRIAGVLPEHSMQLFRITQEALSNAVKHGKASRILISAECSGEELLLQIKNDGVPFQPTGEISLPVRLMTYRAHTINATLTVGPNGRSGTCVKCRMPLMNGNFAKVTTSKKHSQTELLASETVGIALLKASADRVASHARSGSLPHSRQP